eukprot:1151581-Pelagomonas_calceolata.AAC.4
MLFYGIPPCCHMVSLMGSGLWKCANGWLLLKNEQGVAVCSSLLLVDARHSASYPTPYGLVDARHSAWQLVDARHSASHPQPSWFVCARAPCVHCVLPKCDAEVSVEKSCSYMLGLSNSDSRSTLVPLAISSLEQHSRGVSMFRNSRLCLSKCTVCLDLLVMFADAQLCGAARGCAGLCKAHTAAAQGLSI